MTYGLTNAGGGGSQPAEVGNAYSLKMATEVIKDLSDSSIIKAEQTAVAVLDDGTTITPLRNDWTYAPTATEMFEDILTNDHLVAEETLTSIIGESNE